MSSGTKARLKPSKPYGASAPDIHAIGSENLLARSAAVGPSAVAMTLKGFWTISDELISRSGAATSARL